MAEVLDAAELSTLTPETLRPGRAGGACRPERHAGEGGGADGAGRTAFGAQWCRTRRREWHEYRLRRCLSWTACAGYHDRATSRLGNEQALLAVVGVDVSSRGWSGSNSGGEGKKQYHHRKVHGAGVVLTAASQ